MKSQWLILIKFGFVFILLFAALSARAQSRNTVLFLANLDGRAITKHDAKFMKALYKQFLPTHKFVAVEQSKEALPEEYSDKIEKLRSSGVISPEDSITHLIISTHGNSGNGWTNLNGFGKFSKSEMSSGLALLISTLKPNISPKATVVLDACSTVCDGAEASERVKFFLNSLGATEGSLYGSTVEEMSPIFTMPLSRDMGTGVLIKSKLSLLVLSAIAIPSLAAGVSYFLSHYLNISLFDITPMKAYAGMLGVMFWQLRNQIVDFKTGTLASGFVYSLKNDEIKGLREVNKHKNFKEIYQLVNPSCANSFL